MNRKLDRLLRRVDVSTEELSDRTKRDLARMIAQDDDLGVDRKDELVGKYDLLSEYERALDDGHFSGTPFEEELIVRGLTLDAPAGTTVTARYSERAVDTLQYDVAMATEHGWTVEELISQSGHINLGATILAAALTGGLTLLFGDSRTRGYVVLKFERPHGVTDAGRRRSYRRHEE